MEERPITWNLLHKDELIYEVKIRHGVPAEDVNALRTQLRKLVKEYPSDEIVNFEGDVVAELGNTSSKLEELSQLITPTSRNLTLKSLNRIQALAHHLFHRLTRITPDNANLAACNEQMETLNKYLSKLDNLFQIFKTSTQYHIPEESPEVVVDPVPVAMGKYQTVGSLNLKYDGRTCVKVFLQRLDELCKSRGIPEGRLFVSAVELFEGDALQWYRSVKPECTSWTQLESLLLAEFLPFDYDRRLMKEIRSRTQGSQESISSYIGVMLNYFSRLSSPLTEKEKFDIVYTNLRPDYSVPLALAPVESLGELKRVCRVLEDSWHRANTFVEPPRPSSSALASDLGCKSSPRARVETTSPKIFCPRCRSDTHSLRDCRSRDIVCFRCGKKDVRSTSCPDCLAKLSGSDQRPKN